MSSQSISSINDVALQLLELTLQSTAQETFAVGGAIINNATLEVVCALHNNVVFPYVDKANQPVPFTWDPTAHGERQLVSWYFQNRSGLNLPSPDQLTIITSLDPCAMCSGALLTAGFNVGVIAIDTYAGINWDTTFQFHSLPPALRQLAQSKFGYYAAGNGEVDPPLYVRKYIGGNNVALSNTTMTSINLMSCLSVFEATVEQERQIISNSPGNAMPNPYDPYFLPETSQIRQAYQSIYPNAFAIKTDNPRIPGSSILSELERVLNAASDASNAVAFLDHFGNLVLCMADTFDVSPISTCLMNVVQAYSKTRWDLMQDYAVNGQGDDPSQYLGHPKYGTFVFLNAPDPEDSTTVMMLGAYGSTMEGPVPTMFPPNLQFFNPPQNGTLADLYATVIELPPFYSQSVQAAIGQVPSGYSTHAPRVRRKAVIESTLTLRRTSEFPHRLR